MSWVWFTLGAVVMQTVRNALQSQLSETVNVAGVTLARFLFAAPIAGVYLALLNIYSPQSVPVFHAQFLLYVCMAALLQIAATALMVILFKQKNFAVGAGLAKSEALVAGILGTVFFASHLSGQGWLGIFIGAVAVFVLSGGGQRGQLSISSVVIGLACGTCFALTSLLVRHASHSLPLPVMHSAAWVLVWVLCLQSFILITYVAIGDKQSGKALLANKKMTLATSITSCLGSICWFTAMALQHVAYVKTLGQIEVFLTLLLASFWLKNKVQSHEVLGLILIAVAAILVMWA